ncbi:hypothetical protein MHI37_07015 [Paenibacillus sp. FSL H8-0548]|uniref:hypothetical protein n=1 Tax=Paenibacillus sp. FSL H8-0548 TaxID=1920422 RepID=UPI0021170D99|nr:hypothetical protein [Paenibacillus sp. FSL H8-0548]
MTEKDLGITEVRGAKANISDLQVYGDGDTFALLCKASSQSQGWMKSTKVANVDGGCIVQVTTQQKNPDGSYAVAEALTYVPGVNIDKESDPRQLTPIHRFGLIGQHIDSPEDIARRDENEKNYNRREYLGVLIELQKSGHNVHDEINESLKTLKESYGI